MKFPPTTDIRRMRKSMDITQTELAEESGISQSTITKIESGKINASYDTVVALFEALDRMKQKDHKELTAADLYSQIVITIQSTDTVRQASDLMRGTGYSQLPVLNGETPVGSISERGIFELLRRGMTMGQLADMDVSRVMEDSYPVVSDSTPITTVTSLMDNCNAVLVSKKGKIVGMITNADILKLFGTYQI